MGPTGRTLILRRHLLAGAALPVLAVAGSRSAPGQTTLMPASLMLDYSWWPPQIGMIWAKEMGLYKEAGVDLDLRQGVGSGSTVAAVSQGQFQFGFADTPVAAQAIEKGANIKVVAMISPKNGIGVAYRTDSGIKVPKDIEGKKFGSTPTGSDAQLYPAFFNANGIDPLKVQVVSLPGDTKVTALLAKQTHIISGNAFYYAAVVKAKGVDVGQFAYSDYGVVLSGYGLIANGDTIRTSPDLIRRVVAATMKGYQASLANMDRSVDLYLAASKLGDERSLVSDSYRNFERLMDSPAVYGKPSGWNAPEIWESTLATLRAYSGMGSTKAASDFYTNEFLPA